MDTHRIIKLDRKTCLLGATLVVALCGTLYAIGASFTALLEHEAEAAALGHAEFIGRSVHGVEELLTIGQADYSTIQDLRQVRELGDVFHFKVYDHDGCQLLTSDDLDSPGLLSRLRMMDGSGVHAPNDYASPILAGGENHIELREGISGSNEPATYTAALVPLRRDGNVYGAIEIYVDQSSRAAYIWRAFVKVALAVAVLAFLAGWVVLRHLRMQEVDRQRVEERMQYLSEHDPLCGAVNRAGFSAAIERAIRRSERGDLAFAVHCIDLDRFKDVNEQYGQSVGDKMLEISAKRMAAVVRQDDVVARIGGDEFAILQLSVSDSGDIESLGHKIAKCLAEPMEFGGVVIDCSASVGAAHFGVDAADQATLMHKADLAMHRAKLNGRARFCFYDEDLDTYMSDQRVLAADLRHAISDGHLSLDYQPLFASVDASRPIGYEALMRWKHPTRGMIGPAVFIPLAEETGQVVQLGAWALHTACAEAASWTMPLRISVNLSSAQFEGDVPLVQTVSEALDKSGLPAERLEVEITESLLLGNTDHVLDTLNQLSAMGVKIAMDDFGTGYSSLSYLWKFPFDKMKIDRAFTLGIEDDKRVALIVKSIVSLAHSMGMRVTIEGVETQAQMDILTQLGCDELQGYLLGRPMPLTDLHRVARAA